MYTLLYWSTIQGRGEFVRLVLEHAGAAYQDLARLPADQGGGDEAVSAHLYGKGPGQPSFAPPILLDGEFKLGQMPAICAYLAERHDLVVDDRIEGPPVGGPSPYRSTTPVTARSGHVRCATSGAIACSATQASSTPTEVSASG